MLQREYGRQAAGARAGATAAVQGRNMLEKGQMAVIAAGVEG
jgi:hypothetical protein